MPLSETTWILRAMYWEPKDLGNPKCVRMYSRDEVKASKLKTRTITIFKVFGMTAQKTIRPQAPNELCKRF